MAIIIRKLKESKWLRFIGSMRFRMIASYFGLIVCILLLMSLYIVGVLNENLYDNKKVDMFAKANMISDTVSQDWNKVLEDDTEFLEQAVYGSLAGTNIRGVITDVSMRVLYDTQKDSQTVGRIFMRGAIKDAIENQQADRIEKLDSSKIQTVAVPVRYQGNISGTVYLASAVDDIDKIIQTTQMSLIVFSILMCVLVGMLSLGMSYIITSPMEMFIDVAKDISKGNFEKRIRVKGHSEIAQMGEALNYMCAELAHLEEKRRKFVSDASHELKTPMATIKLVCDSIVSAPEPDMDMVKEFLNDLSDEVDRLTRIVDRLLTLTKLDSGDSKMELTLEDIGMMLERIQNKLTPVAAAKNITLHTEMLSQDIQPVLLDYDKIWEALYNIIDNAIKYSKIGSIVTISAQISGENIVLKISDNGPGIPDAYKEKIFERFYRLDDSRARDTGGTGLGLAITKEAISMHDGSIQVVDNEEGGSIFVVTLPYRTKTLPTEPGKE